MRGSKNSLEIAGGRSGDPTCYEHGRIRYDLLARTSRVHRGLQRVLEVARRNRVALMCAEKEPLHCHRTLLVGHELAKRGMDVAHILPNGKLESHGDAMLRLLSECGLESESDLLQQQQSRSELIEDAIRHQTQTVGHSIPLSG